jgi:hypothetical protein
VTTNSRMGKRKKASADSLSMTDIRLSRAQESSRRAKNSCRGLKDANNQAVFTDRG